MAVDSLTMYEEKSFWLRDFGPYAPGAKLNESMQVDVAIVGGGFIGLNTAREFKLKNPGARVAVLESEVIGYGASGRNAGFSMTLFGLEPQVTKWRWGEEKTTQAYRYMIEAVKYTKKIIEDFELDSDYSHPGLVRVAYTPSQARTLKGAFKIFRQLGLAEELGMHWVEKEELQDEFNSPLFLAGLFEEHAGLLHPCKHVRELKRLCLQSGVEVYEQTPVQMIEKRNDHISLETEFGTVKAGKVVLATNAYTHLLKTKNLESLRSRQTPCWTCVIVTERLSEAQWQSVGWAKRQAMEDCRQMIHYFRPTADGRILMGGRDVHAPLGSRSNMDYDHNPKVWQQLERHLRRMFPDLGPIKVAYRWAGPVSVNLDLVPEIGFVGDQRIISATGCMGHGVSLSHLHGRLISDLLNEEKTDLSDFWIVNRKAIRLPGSLAPLVVSNAMRIGLNAVDKFAERSLKD
jgi:glycine/D-amino acid oxidase-like deaminating enzyme